MTNNYYQKHKERLSKKTRGTKKIPKSFWRRKKQKHQYACVPYKNLSEEEKEKEYQYCLERYKNLLEDEKKKV